VKSKVYVIAVFDPIARLRKEPVEQELAAATLG
jgi:hypothetical protein